MSSASRPSGPVIALASRVIALAAVMAVCLPSFASAGMDVYLHTQRSESKLIEVAVPPFQISGGDEEDYGQRASTVINNDLEFSGFFRPTKNYDFMRQASEKDLKSAGIDFDEWRTLASNFLAKGNIDFQKNGNMAVEMRVYDLQTKKLFFSKRYVGPRALFRQIVHQFSDDFITRLTGESGISRTKIAFISKVMGHKELFVMDYDGFNPRALTSDRSIVLLPHWNPKSNLILFTTYRYRNPDLYAIDLKANVRYPISRKIGLNTTGEWSPDGTKVAFSLSRGGNSEIFICSADGSDVRQLTHWKSIETSPTWSPDGRQIAFTSDMSGSPQIYVIDVDGKNRRRITYKGGYNDGAAWSPRGDYIAYASLLDGKFNIALINPKDPGDVLQLTSGNGTNETPSWSPDGRHIAFSSNRDGNKQVYIMNANGENQRQITFLSGGGYTPAWGPSLASK